MMPERLLPVLTAALLLLLSFAAHAEPYLALQQGYKCSSCHVNPTGGGLRTDFGIIFATNLLPQHAPATGSTGWTGNLGRYLRVGADVRTSWSRSEVPGAAATQDHSLDPLRVYAALTVLPRRISLVADEAVAPGQPRALETYLRVDWPGSGAYLKAGQFYLPFGWRLQDQTALVREVTGISMTTADRGVELGYDLGSWSAQLDLSRGAANIAAGQGHELTGQLAWVQARYRLGAATSFTQSQAGNRAVTGVFAGLRTGPVVWLGEADLVRDAGYPEGTRTLTVGLAEADWMIHRGHNLKLSAEYFDPDRAIAEDQKTRWSLLYELTPLPFLQLRAGYRRYDGIVQNVVDNRRLLFLELHAFL